MSNKEIIGLMLKVSKQIRPYKYTVGQLSTLLGDIESHLKGERGKMLEIAVKLGMVAV